MRLRWSALGARLGIGVSVLGLVLVFLGWNGAASHDRVPSQFPYLISGGIGGLALVVIGAAIAVAQSARADRAALQESLRELQDAVERSSRVAPAPPLPVAGGRVGAAGGAPAGVGAAGVVAGARSYHRPTCRLVEGRDAPVITLRVAEELGLEACRICGPNRGPEAGESATVGPADPAPGAPGGAPPPAGPGQRRRKTRPVRGLG